MNLQGLLHFCGNRNLGGLMIVEYAPIGWIDISRYEPMRSSSGNWLYAIPFSTGDWLKMPLLPNGKNWEENSTRRDQGSRFNGQVSGTVPRLQPAASYELQQMEELDFLVKLQDRNGQPWLLGTLEAPLRFKADAGTADENGLNSYRIQFLSQSKQRAAGYAPIC